MGRLLRHSATISTTNALLWGVFWMIVGAIIGWYFSIVPTSIVSFTWGSVSLITQVLYGVALWVALFVPIYVVALFLNSKVGVIDLLGRMLYAHLPVIFMMLPAAFGDKVAYSIFMENPFNAQLSTLYVVLMVLFVAFILVWYIYWSYIAFSRSVNRKGWGVIAMFGVAMMLSYILSMEMLSWTIYYI